MKKIIISILLCLSPALFAQHPYEFLWSSILAKNVTPGSRNKIELNLVNYPAISERQNFNNLVRVVSQIDTGKIKSDAERKAFWINLYNIAVVKMVIDNPFIKDSRSIAWDLPAITLGGKSYSLNQIQNDQLWQFGDPRVLFALSRGSVSGPDLRAEAYTAEKLDQQLDEQTQRFLVGSGKGVFIEKGTKTAYVSAIFNWYKRDFDTEGGVAEFIKKYSATDIRSYKLAYLYYDGGLNSIYR